MTQQHLWFLAAVWVSPGSPSLWQRKMIYQPTFWQRRCSTAVESWSLPTACVGCQCCSVWCWLVFMLAAYMCGGVTCRGELHTLYSGAYLKGESVNCFHSCIIYPYWSLHQVWINISLEITDQSACLWSMLKSHWRKAGGICKWAFSRGSVRFSEEMYLYDNLQYSCHSVATSAVMKQWQFPCFWLD